MRKIVISGFIHLPSMGELRDQSRSCDHFFSCHGSFSFLLSYFPQVQRSLLPEQIYYNK
jgi:hypothetical protein